MSLQENEAILTICLMAAFADGSKSEVERNNFKSIMDSLDSEVSPNLFQNVLLKKVSLEEVAAQLATNESKTLAYEMAVYICDSDDIINQKEKEFLDKLKNLLHIDSNTAGTIEKQGEEIVVIPVKETFEIPTTPNHDAEINKMILNYSILNGALELLPQSLATMAIIPLQTKMVYRIGKYYNYDLDSGHIKEFIATIGLGFTSQVLEGYARKLIGGFAKKFIGKMGKGIASAATGAAFSFGSTYAIGKAAHSYYSGGRKLNTDQLRNLFTKFSDESKSLYTKYQREIQNKARNINVNEIIPMIKGNRLF
jgi:uncharacterized protein (DUF697 family)/tellurite resistance protein